jgi:hypothetical protein
MGLEELRRIREDRNKPKDKKVYNIPKVSAKRQKQNEVEGKIRETTKKMVKTVSGTAELNRWFQDRRVEMVGKCWHCGDPSCKKSDEYYKFSIAHILPKRIFKSVAIHPSNWIELCFWGKSCHTNLDNNMLDIIDLNCFATVIDRFVAMYPAIDPKERRYIPDVLLQYVEVEK